MLPRRQSRFDPMGRENDELIDEEGYGDLGHKHPLRRVQEEDVKGDKAGSQEPVSLPGIKSLFGVAGGDHPTTPSSSSLFQSPSLPSLVPNSPSSSPNSARTSRYSSLASSAVPENQPGWWAPEFDRGSPFQPVPFRSNSFPTKTYVLDEPGQKRRRSDGPPASRDVEESARLRWQAQSRNASFPSAVSPVGGQPGASAASLNGQGLRGLLHPPQASSAAISASMSRSSFSGSTSGTPLSPTMENTTLPPLTSRPSVQSRNPSLVGGQLSRHFADLSANDRTVSSSLAEMPPPLHTAPPDRRTSMHPSLFATDDNRLFPPPLSVSRTPSPGSDLLRRQSVTRPPSPEPVSSRPELRRASLTEIIMAKSGDNLTMTPSRYHPSVEKLSSVGMEKPSLSEPVPPLHLQQPPLNMPLWATRRESTDSVKSASALPTDPDGPLLSLRGRKRSAADIKKAEIEAEVEDQEMEDSSDPAMRGMEVLVAAAAEEERKVRKSSEEDREGSPSKNGGAAGGPKYACAFCAKTFSRPSSLRIHTYSHTGERPYVCKEPTCRRRFSVQSNLKRHAKVHQLGGAGQQGTGGHPLHGHGHPQPPHGGMMHGPPGMQRGPHVHPGSNGHPSSYHPGPPPPPGAGGFYPGPPGGPGPGPGYGGPPPPHFGQQHQQSQPYPPPYHPDQRYGPPPPGMHAYPQPPHPHGPPPQGGYRSATGSRRTSRDGEWSGGEEGEGEGEEEEEIDELDEED
ncbi:hypothetical protein I316_01566 [Kwoniella heveanensis BCC8398]|uniref:C2H2-type domain-containing protein n=1 Tax=Kwoniella heveanensis BCC8398 TaxID=1296120 RepID=A0A1B9H109_9TREE|nr:hypothetical protein I316_01566 [Kwoniella heveanensis BCC8398]